MAQMTLTPLEIEARRVTASELDQLFADTLEECIEVLQAQAGAPIKSWDEDAHPRHPAGTPVDDSTGEGGGRFAPKDGSASTAGDVVAEMAGETGEGSADRGPARPVMDRASAERFARNSAMKQDFWHVTRAENADSIQSQGFDFARSGEKRRAWGGVPMFGEGVYLTDDPRTARYFASTVDAEMAVVPAKVNVTNPLIINMDEVGGEDPINYVVFTLGEDASRDYMQSIDDFWAKHADVDPMSVQAQYQAERRNAMQRLLAKNGYDALYVTEENPSGSVGGTQIVISDPSQIAVISGERPALDALGQSAKPAQAAPASDSTAGDEPMPGGIYTAEEFASLSVFEKFDPEVRTMIDQRAQAIIGNIVKKRAGYEYNMALDGGMTEDRFAEFKLYSPDIAAGLFHVDGLQSNITAKLMDDPAGYAGKQSMLELHCTWTDENGEEVGQCTRRFVSEKIARGIWDERQAWNRQVGNAVKEYDDRDKDVDFAWMGFEEGKVKRGVAVELVHRQMQMLKAFGYKRAELYANATIGKYAWAKEGAEYRDASMARYASRKFVDWAKDKGIDLGDQWPDFQNVYEVATFDVPGITLKGSDIRNIDTMTGRPAVPPDMVMHLGKAFLLDSNIIDNEHNGKGHGSWDAYYHFDKLGKPELLYKAAPAQDDGEYVTLVIGNAEGQGSDHAFWANYLTEDERPTFSSPGDDLIAEMIGKSWDESKVERWPAGTPVDDGTGAGGGRFAPKDDGLAIFHAAGVDVTSTPNMTVAERMRVVAGVKDSEDRPITEEARRMLAIVEPQIADQPFEEIYVMTEEGRIIGHATGDYDSVTAQIDADDSSRKIVTHNHPDLSAPSLTDITTAIRRNIREMRVVAGENVYIVTMPDVEDRRVYGVLFESAFSRVMRQTVDHYGQLYRNGDLPLYEANEIVSHAVWRNFLDKYGEAFGISMERVPLANLPARPAYDKMIRSISVDNAARTTYIIDRGAGDDLAFTLPAQGDIAKSRYVALVTPMPPRDTDYNKAHNTAPDIGLVGHMLTGGVESFYSIKPSMSYRVTRTAPVTASRWAEIETEYKRAYRMYLGDAKRALGEKIQEFHRQEHVRHMAWTATAAAAPEIVYERAYREGKDPWLRAAQPTGKALAMLKAFRMINAMVGARAWDLNADDPPRWPAGTPVDPVTGAGGGRFAPKDGSAGTAGDDDGMAELRRKMAVLQYMEIGQYLVEVVGKSEDDWTKEKIPTILDAFEAADAENLSDVARMMWDAGAGFRWPQSITGAISERELAKMFVERFGERGTYGDLVNFAQFTSDESQVIFPANELGLHEKLLAGKSFGEVAADIKEKAGVEYHHLTKLFRGHITGNVASFSDEDMETIYLADPLSPPAGIAGNEKAVERWDAAATRIASKSVNSATGAMVDASASGADTASMRLQQTVQERYEHPGSDSIAHVAGVVAESLGIDAPDAKRRVRRFDVDWVEASNDKNGSAIQLEASERFGVEPSDWQKGKIDRAKGWRLMGLSDAKEKRAIVDAHYEHTQELLKKAGVKEVRLFRGVALSPEQSAKLKRGDVMQFDDNILSSWTPDLDEAFAFATDIAHMFAMRYGTKVNAGAIISTVVPAERIFATAFTGVGYAAAKEFVVIGTSEPAHAMVHAIYDDKPKYGGKKATKSWDESAHPRHPAGTPVDDSTGEGGGRFAPKDGSAPGPAGDTQSARSPIPYKLKPSTARRIDDDVREFVRQKIVDAMAEESITPEDVEAYARQLIKDWVKNNDVAIRMDLEDLPAMLRDGRYKTQFETGESNGHLDNEGRSDAERNGMGVPSTIDPKLRPVYGYVAVPGLEGYVSGYGKVKVVLKGDVKQRSTFTLGDSLSMFLGKKLYGLSPDNFDSAGLGWVVYPEHLLKRVSEQTPADEATKLILGSHRYIETQIHGGVSVDDIERVEWFFNGDQHEAGMYVRELSEVAGLVSDTGINFAVTTRKKETYTLAEFIKWANGTPTKSWDEEAHPRHPAGTPVDPATGEGGGRFAPKDSTAGESGEGSAESGRDPFALTLDMSEEEFLRAYLANGRGISPVVVWMREKSEAGETFDNLPEETIKDFVRVWDIGAPVALENIFEEFGIDARLIPPAQFDKWITAILEHSESEGKLTAHSIVSFAARNLMQYSAGDDMRAIKWENLFDAVDDPASLVDSLERLSIPTEYPKAVYRATAIIGSPGSFTDTFEKVVSANADGNDPFSLVDDAVEPAWSTKAIPYAPSKELVEKLDKDKRDDVTRMIEERGYGGAINAYDVEDYINRQVAAAVVRYPVAVRVSLEDVDSVQAAGRLMSQFETGTSNGDYAPESRKAAENKGMGVPYSIEPKQRPIYGYIGTPKHSAGMYGDVEFVMKDAIKQRTTITAGDSLYDFQSGAQYGLPIPMIGNTGTGWVALPASMADATNEKWSFDDAINRFTVTHSYIEAQMHGGVSLGDVDRVIYRHRAYSFDLSKRAGERVRRAGERFDAAGIPFTVSNDGDPEVPWREFADWADGLEERE